MNSSAQSFYSVKPDYLRSRQEGSALLGRYENSYPDSSISAIHEFFPRNFSGNYGLAQPDYILNYKVNDLGFQLSPSFITNDRFMDKDVRYYRTKGPFAELTGVAGSRQLQVLKMIFTHTYKDKVNITLKFNRYTSQGFYQKQRSYTNNVYLSSNYTSTKKRWGYLFYYLNNSNRSQENGGLVNDTLDNSELVNPKELLAVRMSSAVRDNKEHKAQFNTWFKLAGKSDSLDQWSLYLQLCSKFNFQYWMHEDAASGTEKNYLLYYHDTLKTYDSTALLQLKNDILFTFAKPRSGQGVSIGLRNEYDQLYQKTDSLFMNNIFLGNAYFSGELGKDSVGKRTIKWYSQTNLQYVVDGPNKGDYHAEERIGLGAIRPKQKEAYLLLSSTSRHADHIYNNWNSNHFYWINNQYKPSITNQVKVGVSFKGKYDFSFFAQSIQRFLYFNEQVYPEQYSGSVQNIGVSTSVDLLLLRHLGIYFSNVYQQTSHKALVSIPQNIFTARVFYSANLFHKNLQLNIGAQVQQYQSFYAYAYNPANQMFYLQQQKTTSNYPFVDVYLNARIRPVSIFVKVENVLQNYVGNDYALAKGYFQPDRSFRFGISWMFFD